MKRHLLLSAVAVCLVLPAAALADPPSGQQPGADKTDHKKEKPKDQGPRRPRPKGSGEAVQPTAPPVRPARPHPLPAPQAPIPQAPIPQDRVPHAPAPQPQARPTPPARVRPPAVTPPPALPSFGAWTAPRRGPDRDRAGQQWRQQHQDWDRDAAWRRAPDWYRHDSGFRLFVGVRIGYFFVPQIGYVSVPRQYRNHHWQEGEYLPRWFRAYTVSHYERYGLPRPPRGCVWIWLNGDVALIDRSDGYILVIARNVWR